MVVQVFALDIGEFSLASEWLGYLSAEKQDRIRNIKDSLSARQVLAADLLIRALACRYLGVTNNSLRFKTNSHGKPRLDHPADTFHFNLSHSGNWVVCAIDESEVGVDVQQIEPVDPKLAEYCLSPAEYQVYGSCPPEQQKDFFYNIWTRNESCLKLIGQGWSLSPHSLSFSGTETGYVAGNLICCPRAYFRHHSLGEGFTLATCSLNERFIPDIGRLTKDWIARSLV